MRSSVAGATQSNVLKVAIILALAVASFFVSRTIIYAQGNGFQLTPPTVELEADPGETVVVDGQNALSVRNITGDPLVAVAEFNDFLPQDESGTPTIITDPEEVDVGDYSMREYFRDVEPFRLEPGERVSIPITIDVPENASPGGHYGVIRFTARTPEGDRAVALSASVGTLFLVNVSGDVQEDLDLIETGTSKDGEDGTFFQSGPVSVYTRFQNVGNTHTKPFGNVMIKNMFGQVIEEFEVNPNRANVLPDSVRRFENQLSDGFYFGRYTVEGALAYGNGNGDILDAQTTFWVLPIGIIAGGLAAIVALFFGGRAALRRYNERVISKSRTSRR